MWKNLPYWVRGIIISSLLYFALVLGFGESHRETLLSYLNVKLSTLLLLFFIIGGALLGWIYPKFK